MKTKVRNLVLLIAGAWILAMLVLAALILFVPETDFEKQLAGEDIVGGIRHLDECKDSEEPVGLVDHNPGCLAQWLLQ